MAIALVEWPERLGGYAPEGAMRLVLEYQGDARLASVFGAREGMLAALRAVA